METKHSPLPWRVGSDYGDRKNMIWSTGGPSALAICEPPCVLPMIGEQQVIEANAEFIVRAVNAHEELTMALEHCLINWGSHYREKNGDDNWARASADYFAILSLARGESV